MSQVPPIEIAGRTVRDPLTVVAGYCHDHEKTLRHYDWVAGTTNSLTREQITATYRMSSRISRMDARWLLSQAATAPWDTVDEAALLSDADPAIRGGLYDQADSLYVHFYRSRPRNVNHAKVSKCLYLMRPGLIPVLDSRVLKLYRRPARAAARELAGTGFPYTWAYWAAIRKDLLRAGKAWTVLRDELREVDADGVHGEAANRLSDLRLLDILAWSLAMSS